MFRLFGSSRVPAAVQDSMTATPLQPTQPGVSFAGHLQVPATDMRTNAPYVSRILRNKERIMYSRGAQQREVFHMRMTGGVESSLANTWDQGYTFNAFFNDGLFEAGYPRNNGLSVKLEQVPPDLKHGVGPYMQAAPQARSSIFTRRAFYGAPTKTAKPASS